MLKKAVQNLLVGCGGLSEGAEVLIVHESPGLGYYDDDLAPAILTTAQTLGFRPSMLEVPFSFQPVLSDELSEAVAKYELTVFLARIGDQIRFKPASKTHRATVCYALDLSSFASSYAAIPHQLMMDLCSLLDAALAQADDINVTCPAGTRLRGRVTGPTPPQDMNSLRFPRLVYTPLPAIGFSGRIAQDGFLVGTGSHFYEPYAVELTETLLVETSGNAIVGFDGRDAKTAERHYDILSEKFGIDGRFIHSWHGGIHPSCAFPGKASDSFERWSGSAFGNPRLLHFHTCGNYAPGEISLNIVDPTVSIDGVAVWENGRLYPERVAGGSDVLDRCRELRDAFTHPEQACGLGQNGRLCFD